MALNVNEFDISDKVAEELNKLLPTVDGSYAEFAAALKARGVDTVVVVGLATDYCVHASARDARAAGFDVVVPRDAVRAVDVEAGDGERALAELASLGVDVVDRVADAACG